MPASKYAHKRRVYFIKKDFQLRFILKFCFVMLAGTVISTCLVFFFSKGTLTSSFHGSRLVVENTAHAILPAVIATNLITLGLIILATIVVTLFVSHKLAGPMFRFEQDLKVIGGGDLSKKIRLREKDQLTDFAESLNQMIHGLSTKIILIQEGVDELMASATCQEASEEVIRQLNALQKTIKENFII